MISTYFKLNNDFYTIEISEKGAELQSIFHHKLNKEILWQGDQNYWPRRAPVLFPIVGKLLNNSYLYDNNIYNLSQHGFARDCTFILFDNNEHSVSYILTADENTFKIFPFKFVLIITYTIDKNTIKIKYKIINQDQKTMLCSIGGHPGFNCPLFENEKLDDYKLTFELTEEPTRFNLSDGLIANQYQEKPFQTIQLTEELFKDDALIYTHLKSSYVDFSNNNNYTLRFTFNQMPYLAFWKKADAPFVCIEPWHGIADHVENMGNIESKTGMIHLKPNQEFETECSISVL